MSSEHLPNKLLCKNYLLNNREEEKNIILKLRYMVYNKFGVWDVLDLLPKGWRYYYYDYIKPIFKPCHSKLRKSIPRTWIDLSGLVVSMNFQVITSFYEDEYVKGIVDWEGSSDGHNEFATWLEASYKYITVERKELEKQKEDAYPVLPPPEEMFIEEKTENGKTLYKYNPGPGTYEEKYGKVNRLEKIIEDKDTEILLALIKYRDYLWT